MKLKRLASIIPAVAVALLSASYAHAALSYSGQFNPADPAAWTTSTAAYVGQTADGSLTVDGGSAVTSKASYLGYNAGVTGTVTVTGSGSTWTTGTSSNRYVGYNGTGVMNITSGGVVSNTSIGYLGYNAGSAGTVTVDGTGSAWSNSTLYVGNNGSGTLNITNAGAVTVTSTTSVGLLGTINFGNGNGGTLTTGSLNVSPSQLSGAGTINTSGIVSDANLVFNASRGTTQTFTMNGVTVNLTQGSTRNLGAGYLGTGSLSIADGVTVTSSSGYLGYYAGSTGTGTVEGAGSNWTNSGLYVGYNGSGTLNIASGGAVTANGNVNVGYSATAAGTLNVANGALTATGNLNVGNNAAAAATINITGGGTVAITGNTTVGALGTINFGTNGGTLTTGSLYAGAAQLSGVGTINTSGIVSDASLVFNAAQGTTQSFAMNGITVNLTQSSSRDLGVGYTGSGSLGIVDGVTVSSGAAYLGYNSGSTGTASIVGANSKWISSGSSYIGRNGTGTLNITNGGSGNFSSYVYAGYTAGSTGAINVDGAGSYLGTGGFYVGSAGSGTLAVTNGATVVSGAAINLGSGTGGVGSAVVSGPGSRWAGGADMYVGGSGTGSMLITNGGIVTNRFVTIGSQNGGVGTVTVNGVGSTWNTSAPNTYGLSIGGSGTGRLYITNGGTVNSGLSWVGPGIVGTSTGKGLAVVDGAGSKWNNSGSTFNIGEKGNGKLSISGGGAVTSARLDIYASGILTIDVGKGSSLAVDGTLTNNGTLRMVAGAAAANGAYTPVTATTWAGTGGTVQALGGIWDVTNHTVTVSSAAAVAAGAAVTIDLATTQRFLFTDGASGKSVGAAFQAATTPTNLTVTASSIGGGVLSSLQSALYPGQTVLSGWDFTTEGYTAGDPVCLSLFAGSGQGLSNLNIWHYDGSAWSKYEADDLAYDNNFASFTVNSLSGYAVSGAAPVPVPAAAWLFGSGLMGLVGMRRRFFKV